MISLFLAVLHMLRWQYQHHMSSCMTCRTWARSLLLVHTGIRVYHQLSFIYFHFIFSFPFHFFISIFHFYFNFLFTFFSVLIKGNGCKEISSNYEKVRTHFFNISIRASFAKICEIHYYHYIPLIEDCRLRGVCIPYESFKVLPVQHLVPNLLCIHAKLSF